MWRRKCILLIGAPSPSRQTFDTTHMINAPRPFPLFLVIKNQMVGRLGNEAWYMYKATSIIVDHCMYMHDEKPDTSLPPRLSRLNCCLLSTCGQPLVTIRNLYPTAVPPALDKASWRPQQSCSSLLVALPSVHTARWMDTKGQLDKQTVM